MPIDLVDLSDGPEGHRTSGRIGARPVARPRLPSTASYMAVAGVIAFALFFAVWWLFIISGDDAPWLPSMLAASVVLLLAVATREVIMRRAWARYTHELELEMGRQPSRPSTRSRSRRKVNLHSTAVALRALLQRLAQIDEAGAQRPAAHWEAFRLCEQYLANSVETLNSPRRAPDVRIALRSGQERVRALQRHHLLAWARGESRRLSQEAQRRVSVSDKIETAMRASEVIDEALKHYPDEAELRASALALRDFIASVRVGHWVELAERAAFRGRPARAVARYHDALFYLSRTEMSEDARAEAAAHINDEIEKLRAQMAISDADGKIERRAAEPPAKLIIDSDEERI